MIILYHPETGFIYQTINDPVPVNIESALLEQGKAFISKPVIPMEEDVIIDKGTGQPMLDDKGVPLMAPKGYLNFVLPDNAYVDPMLNDVALRPNMNEILQVSKLSIIANGIDTTIITGVPTGAKLYVNGEFIEMVDDGSVELQADTPGEYDIQLEDWPYLNGHLIIIAE